jgi:hypothetical protein
MIDRTNTSSQPKPVEYVPGGKRWQSLAESIPASPEFQHKTQGHLLLVAASRLQRKEQVKPNKKNGDAVKLFLSFASIIGIT